MWRKCALIFCLKVLGVINYSGRRHRVKVSAPFLGFCVTFNMQASIACILGLVTSHLNMAIWRRELLFCMAERPQSWNVPMKKCNSQRLKRTRSLLSGIRRLQSNTIFCWMELSLKIFGRVRRSTIQQHARLVSAMQVMHVQQLSATVWSKTERLRCQIQGILQVWKCKIWTQIGLHVTEWLCTVNNSTSREPYLYILRSFEPILKHAKRLGYEIQDILYGNAWIKQECESFEGLWVNLAFYRESDTAGARTSVSKSWMISYIVNTSIYLSMWYHYQLHRNWNQFNFMDHKNLARWYYWRCLCVYCMACFVVWLQL